MKKTRRVVLWAICGVALALATVAVAGDCECGPGVRSPGYWKNHPEAWPCAVGIGNQVYTAEEAIALLQTPPKGDKRYTLFAALVAAKLNIANGNCSDCIDHIRRLAEDWFNEHPLPPDGNGDPVPASSEAWKCAEPWYLKLDAYNNGLLCAPPVED